MNQAGMILALILLSIPAEMVKGSRASKPSKSSKSSKRSKSSKSSQYNTIQYSTIQYNPIQYNSITREYRTKVRSRPPGSLRKEKAPGIPTGHRGEQSPYSAFSIAWITGSRQSVLTVSIWPLSQAWATAGSMGSLARTGRPSWAATSSR